MLKLIVFLLAGYALLVVSGCAFQRALMYFPGHALPDPADAGLPEMRAVTLRTADDLDLISWYASARAGRPTLVYFQGNGATIAERAHKARAYLDAGLGLLLVGYRGYGGNPGRPSETGLLADGEAALAFIAARGVPPARTVVLGESLGTGVAVQLAARHEIGALMLEAPFTSAVDVARRAYWYLPVGTLMWDRFDSIAVIERIEAPLLVIHGERDSVIPIALGKRLFEAAPEPKTARWLAAANHNNMDRFGLMRIEIDWLAATLGE